MSKILFRFTLAVLYFFSIETKSVTGPKTDDLSQKSSALAVSPRNSSLMKVIDVSSEDVIDPVKRAKTMENEWKKLFKNGVKWILPMMMNYSSTPDVSSKCMRDLMKYIGALMGAKVWAAKMFDACSKLPAGVFEGTLSDFGSYDQCLDIMVPLRNGSEDFRGSYCAIEARPYMPDIPINFTMAVWDKAGPHDTIAKELLFGMRAFFYLKFRLGLCAPSSCSTQDITNIAHQVGEKFKLDIKVPQCYVKEGISFNAIHIVVTCVLIVLVLLCIAGTIIDLLKTEDVVKKWNSLMKNVLLAFSIPSNYNKLMTQSKGREELKALHGIRGLSIVWIILGHTYIWSNFQILSRPIGLQEWFKQVEFEAILNTWLSVETFFFLSGLLTCYGCIQVMQKTKGRINVPFFILRRYIRLMPPLLMVMGLMFFLPLISSGPFWYETMAPELVSCRKNWWTSLLFVSNWGSVRQICNNPTWFLSADFQLHILSLLVLFPLYRSWKLGATVMGMALIASNVPIAILTYVLELPPTVSISSGNPQKISETIDNIHIQTFTHAGPFVVGIATGYLILKFGQIKLPRMVCFGAWCASFAVSVASLYGVHTWNAGHPHGSLLTSVYACFHRTTFSLGVAWVAFACITGHAGPVNTFLSLPALAPLSRLTFCIYLTQSLVIWTRRSSARERLFNSHYNHLYEFLGNLIVSIIVAVPLHLLVEAPVANLDRLLFTRVQKSKEEPEEIPKDDNSINLKISFVNGFSNSINSFRTSTISVKSNVELKSVKTVQDSNSDYSCQNICND